MGGAGDPLPTRSRDDPPTGTAASNVAKRRRPLARAGSPRPSAEPPDGTGESPVLPANDFSNTLLGKSQSDTVPLVWCLVPLRRRFSRFHQRPRCGNLVPHQISGEQREISKNLF